MKYKLIIEKKKGLVETQTNSEEQFLSIVNGLDFKTIKRVGITFEYADGIKAHESFTSKHDLLVCLPKYMG